MPITDKSTEAESRLKLSTCLRAGKGGNRSIGDMWYRVFWGVVKIF